MFGKIRTYIISYLLLLSTANVFAGNTDSLEAGSIEKRTIMLPRVYAPLELKASLSVVYTKLPLDWGGADAQIPLFQLIGRIGLPAGFTLNSDIQSIYISNQVRLGPKWNYTYKKFSAALGFDFAYLYWTMNDDRLKNRAWAWSGYPNVSIGYNAGDITFTVVGEMNFIYSLDIEIENIVITRKKNFLSGRNVGLYVEQKLWGNHIMVLGFIYNYQRVFHSGWSALDAFSKRYSIPQVSVGLVF